jgi:adenine-specific DNA-methyltransferase
MVCLLNSSPIQQRFVDHLRVLGGGLLKFQPNDLLSIEIPDIRILSDAEISTLNSYLVRLDLEMRLQRQTNCAEIEVMADLSQYVENLIAVKFEGGEIGITSRVHVQRCT